MSYMTGHSFQCKSCEYYGSMIGHNSPKGFIHTCPECNESWVAMTPEEEELLAKDIMEDALS